jgi:hypothetical protein
MQALSSGFFERALARAGFVEGEEFSPMRPSGKPTPCIENAGRKR